MTLSRRSLLRSLLGGAALAATATLGRVCAPAIAAPELEHEREEFVAPQGDADRYALYQRLVREKNERMGRAFCDAWEEEMYRV